MFVRYEMNDGRDICFHRHKILGVNDKPHIHVTHSKSRSKSRIITRSERLAEKVAV